MAKLTAIIEKGPDGGFNVYSTDVEGVYAAAPTEDEVKQEFMEMLHEEAEDMRELTGTYPEWYNNGGIDIEFTYSSSNS